MKGKRIADMTKRTMTLSRQQLYDEIWQMSVSGVARKYNLNYSKLIAKCREANIPFPPSGYWTRKSMGKDVSGEVVVLPPSDNSNVELLLAEVKLEKTAITEEKVKETWGADIAVPETKTIEESDIDDAVLPFLDIAEKKRVLQVASELSIRDKKRLHEQLIKYRNSITEWKRKEKEGQNQRWYNPRHNKTDSEPAFFNEISAESQQRVFLCCRRTGWKGECRSFYVCDERYSKNPGRRRTG